MVSRSPDQRRKLRLTQAINQLMSMLTVVVYRESPKIWHTFKVYTLVARCALYQFHPENNRFMKI
jgi:hypothetical protein